MGNRIRQKNKGADRKTESNASPEIPDRGGGGGGNRRARPPFVSPWAVRLGTMKTQSNDPGRPTLGR